jgi:hypothetical protein
MEAFQHQCSKSRRKTREIPVDRITNEEFFNASWQASNETYREIVLLRDGKVSDGVGEEAIGTKEVLVVQVETFQMGEAR